MRVRRKRRTRITNIEIKNYRQYQSLSFTFPQSTDTDIHIIIAQNGVGKTNLLNAITWCLYGTEPHLSDKDSSTGLPKLNLTALNEARASDKEIEYVDVTIKAQDEDMYITYNRRLPFRVTSNDFFEKSAEEKFTVIVSTSNGDPKIYEDKAESKRFVDKYVPEKIREYFYFDGEQLNNYFIGPRSGKVKEAIFSISQVDVVHLIRTRIDDIIVDKKKDAASKVPNIKKITDQINTLNDNIDSVNKRIKQHEEQVAESEQIIKANTEYLQSEENVPELEKTYQELKNRKNRLEEAKKELMEDIFSFVREMKITMAFYAATKKTLDIIAQKEANKTLPPNIDKVLLQNSLEKHICTICNQPLSTDNEQFIKNVINSFQVSTTASHLLLSIKNELERIVKTAETYSKVKQDLKNKYQSLEKSLTETDAEFNEIDRRIRRVPDKDEVKHRHTERQDHEQLKNINREKLGAAKSQLSQFQEEKGRLDSEFERAIQRDGECSRIKQLIEFATKGRNVIDDVEKDMMNEVRIKMEELTTSYFMQLIWKKNTYAKIILDQDFRLDLIHKEGYSCVATCSAAERCLLALSFTLALHEVSGFTSLLFIDTPVARVSDVNRINFANVLCEVSNKKQIIMTFSPDEYSPEIKRIFDPKARTKVELGMVDEKITVLK
jgi:DNA sulfur modification protein DndD